MADPSTIGQSLDGTEVPDLSKGTGTDFKSGSENSVRDTASFSLYRDDSLIRTGIKSFTEAGKLKKSLQEEQDRNNLSSWRVLHSYTKPQPIERFDVSGGGKPDERHLSVKAAMAEYENRKIFATPEQLETLKMIQEFPDNNL